MGLMFAASQKSGYTTTIGQYVRDLFKQNTCGARERVVWVGGPDGVGIPQSNSAVNPLNDYQIRNGAGAFSAEKV